MDEDNRRRRGEDNRRQGRNGPPQFVFQQGGGPAGFGGIPIGFAPLFGAPRGAPAGMPIDLAQLLGHAMFRGPAFQGDGGMSSMDQLLERLRASYEPPSHPTSKSFLDSLPNVEVTEKHAHDTQACAVCQEDYSLNEQGVISLPCNHLFHKECLAGWLKDNNVCPVCRFELPEEKAAAQPQRDGAGAGDRAADRRRAPYGHGEDEGDVEMIGEEEDNEADMFQAFDPAEIIMSRLLGLPIGPGTGMGRPPGAGAGRGPVRRTVHVDQDGFADEEMAEAIAASLAASGGESAAAGAGAPAPAPAAARPRPGAGVAAGAGAGAGEGGRGGRADDLDPFAQAMYDSIVTLSTAELQEQCALESIDIPPSKASDRTALLEALCTHQGVDVHKLRSVREARERAAARSPVPHGRPVVGYNRPPTPPPDFLSTVHVPAEPASDDPSAFHLRLRLPDGANLTRRFDLRDTVGQVVAFMIHSIGPARALQLGIVNGPGGVPQLRLREAPLPGAMSAGQPQAAAGFGPAEWDKELGETGLQQRSMLLVEALP